MRKPIAFMSYVREDDRHLGGRLSKFRERLSSAVRFETGKEFPIFQDREDIHWGQEWRDEIDRAIASVEVFIPIITPGFFQSEPCRYEFEKFRQREAELGRSDRILSVYYTLCPFLHDPVESKNDELAEIVIARNWIDWRKLRFQSFDTPDVEEALAQFAVQIRETLTRDARPAAPQQTSKATPTTDAASAQPATATQQTKPPALQTEPPILVVDQLHRGDFPTISEAIKAAKPGTRILVRPGLYLEGFVMDKPLEIIGDGEPGEIIVRAAGKHALLFKTAMGRVANLTLRQMGGGDFYGVDIAQGRLEMESCDVSSQSNACVGIHDYADPRLRRNRIHDGKQGGVYISENGQGILEDNNIVGNTYSGIQIATGGNPTLRRNRIQDGKAGGAFVHDNGQGVLEDNDIVGNTLAGVEIKTGGAPVIRKNRINRNGYEAVWVYEGGAGTIEDNDLRENPRSAWNIAEDCKDNVKRARNLE